MEAKFINKETRKKIIEKSCNRLKDFIDEKLWPFEIPTSIHIEGNYGTMIEFIIETKKHEN